MHCILKSLRVLTLFLAVILPTTTRAATPPPRTPEGFRPHIVFLIGEEEYNTKTTLPAFAVSTLEPLGFRCTFVHCNPTNKNHFPEIDAVSSANLLFLSTRRRALSEHDLQLIRRSVKSGRPILGIRTASHAFDPLEKENVPPTQSWPRFDVEILGADYQGHYGVGPQTLITQNPKVSTHPILKNIPTSFTAPSHLYKNHNPAPTVTILLQGITDDRKSELEPVAWINSADDRRVFYTSLGTEPDFQNAHFRQLLLNATQWCLGVASP